ncbi:MAG: GvpL/GvpF family gas vesicle protein [Thermodesulfovibrionales bacterium]|nr:GvpL/GvpF family gas vesicle protein [Thermodesulfovibrionales bacterium]
MNNANQESRIENRELKREAIYLYCIADGNEKVNFGEIGIDGSEVYALPYQEISAIVHNCESRPYESKDRDIVKNWVMTHQNVVDCAWQKFGAVLPLAFDTIIIGEEDIDPKENMRKWLQKDYQNLKEKLNKVKGKAEYGVQVLWSPKVIVERIAQNTTEIKNLKEELKSKPPGTAYMYEEKIKNVLRKEMEKKADEYFKDFYTRIKKEVFDIRIEKTKKVDENLQMIMNLSCLVANENVEKLGNVLEEIKKEDGLIIRFTGPWPPYSFV